MHFRFNVQILVPRVETKRYNKLICIKLFHGLGINDSFNEIKMLKVLRDVNFSIQNGASSI